ncbi:Lytic chitin monooxygenase [Psilocybe cubensis]|uniref:Lytic chitin monooxygenase n=2 Tax=Psilocybe cubensis TaxID=181762 RepID=A0ACB8GLP5_PSICU|nr:Lytic chitin monooxygenase [Psilocybe cubensis]KAH9476461.1 Lytic chitin monooxygenase [Psilocybe cubensis]
MRTTGTIKSVFERRLDRLSYEGYLKHAHSMINFMTLALLALAILYSVAPAVGNGFVNFPPSRQARCLYGQVPDCGDVQYEPQSVEGLAGSFSCNGDGERFHELNDNSLFENLHFSVPEDIEKLSFTWVITAPHRTIVWEYFVITQDNTLLYSDQAFNQTPPATLTHMVPLNGIKGAQTVLARWTIGDTENAFYSCVDLLIVNAATATATPGAVATPAPVSMPSGFHDSARHENSVNRSAYSSAESSHTGAQKAIQKKFYIQGPHS